MWTYWKVSGGEPRHTKFVYRSFAEGKIPTRYQRWDGEKWIDVGFPNMISDAIYEGEPSVSEASEAEVNAFTAAHLADKAVSP
jgi:hypothetical protein